MLGAAELGQRISLQHFGYRTLSRYKQRTCWVIQAALDLSDQGTLQVHLQFGSATNVLSIDLLRSQLEVAAMGDVLELVTIHPEVDALRAEAADINKKRSESQLSQSKTRAPLEQSTRTFLPKRTGTGRASPGFPGS